MGLFGLFYTALGLGCKGAMGIKNSLEDNENRTKYRDNETNTYLDHNMTKRDLNTNHVMTYHKANNGDILLKDCETGKYVKNISQDRAEKKYQEERAKALRCESDRTHIRYGDDEHRKDTFPGYRYKDFKTGKLYVERFMVFTEEHYKMLHLWSGYGVSQKSFSVLFDPETRKIVRLTDRTIESMLGQGALMEDINAFFPIYVKEYYENMSEPYNTFYKDRLYYQRTLYNEADSLKDNFIKEEEARVRYRRGKK